MTELRKIPNVEKRTEQDLIAMGYTTIASLRGKRAEDLYAEECRLRACVLDRCQLYLYRAVEYFVNTENPDPAKCKWWLWKDEFTEPSPCGAVCAECGNFPTACGGCRKIGGKVFWVQFTGDKVCPVYQCCREKKKRNCGGCPELPCARFMKDPTISDEENTAHLQKMLERLGKTTIRPLRLEEITMLRDFLYEAIYLPEGTPSPPRSVMDLPELQVYIQNFGTRSDDHCLVAESSDKVIGAVWVRQMEDFGHVDDHTPSLAIALYQGFRGKGIGTRLLQEMIDLLHRKGYKQVSLSVQKANPAVRLYRRLGFETIRETEDEYIMACNLSPDSCMSNNKPNKTTNITFRSVTMTDIPELKELFRNTVLTVNARDYTAEEVADWASCGNSPGRWEELLATLHFIVACDTEGRIVGFTSIRNDGYLHSMFIHKDHQGEGIATALLQRIEAYATEHGIREITSEVSITARPFFERKGYKVIYEQKALCNRLYIKNYWMKKRIPTILNC